MRLWVFAVLYLAGCNSAADCRSTTQALESMSGAKLALNGPGERTASLTVRVADDHRERAGGFQHVCAETIRNTSIFFVFPSLRRPRFHMHNVKAALDIAFVDEDGVIVDIQRMEPYVPGTSQYLYYSPPARVAAALETRAGWFARYHISPGTWKVELLEQ